MDERLKRRLTVEKIHDMYAQGMTYQAIADKVGVSRQRIQQIVRPPIQIVNMLKKRANGRCENCGIVPRNAHVHHTEKIAALPKTLDSIEFLLYLCPSCHRRAHRGPGRDWTPMLNSLPFIEAAKRHGLEVEWFPSRQQGNPPMKRKFKVNGHICVIRESSSRSDGKAASIYRTNQKADFCIYRLKNGQWMIVPFKFWPRQATMFILNPTTTRGAKSLRHDWQDYVEAWYLLRPSEGVTLEKIEAAYA
jgi:Homeodomain-like domain-containing protein/HNH endonuclease